MNLAPAPGPAGAPEMTAYCGLPCSTCPIRVATLEPNEGRRGELRVRIAASCREEYGLDLGPSDITDCDGCRAGGRLFSGCRECRIRPCAAARGVESCAACPDYGCDLLLVHFAGVPESRVRLQQLRHSRGMIDA